MIYKSSITFFNNLIYARVNADHICWINRKYASLHHINPIYTFPENMYIVYLICTRKKRELLYMFPVSHNTFVVSGSIIRFKFAKRAKY